MILESDRLRDAVSGFGAPRSASVLLSPGNASSLAEVADFVAVHYGFAAQLVKLRSERDENYRVTSSDGVPYLFKISHAAEDRAIVDFQTRALLHVAAAEPSVPLQRLVPAVSGAFAVSLAGSDGLTRQARMFTYLSGLPLGSLPQTSALAAGLGILAARLDLGLRDFHHHAAGHELLWDIQHAAKTRELLPQTRSRTDRDLCERTLDIFERRVAPGLSALRSQVIHNDLNPHNVLVNAERPEQVTGIIDFGDMVRAPLIDEVAVASAYMLAANEAPLGVVPQFVSAYHTVAPLEAKEIAMLPQLIAVRHAITIAITNWRAAKYPENRDYIIRNQESAVKGLNKLFSLSEALVLEQLMDACATPAR